MKSKFNPFRLLSAVWMLLLFLLMSPWSASAGDVDCAANSIAGCGFGTQVGNTRTTMLMGKGWTGTLEAFVFNNAGTYSYIYDTTLGANSDQVSRLMVGSDINGNDIDLFDRTLNWGVLTNRVFTSNGVDDCADTRGVGCPSGTMIGFSFGDHFFSTNVANFGATQAASLQYTFYAQAKLAPGAGSFGASVQELDFFSTTAPVPEASTWAMIALGFVGLAWVARRRNANRRVAPA